MEFFNVLRLSREDFKARGFNADDLGDETMASIAEKIGKVILEGGDFWLAVDFWGEELSLPKYENQD